MPVHNAAACVGEALDSILRQTCPDFELLVIDDGSSDDSAGIIRARRDPRIRLVRRDDNRGIVRTLNEGLALARGAYVARMDADDISHPERLARQRRFLDEHRDIGLCGTAFDTFGETTGGGWVRYFDHEAIEVALLFGNPICHPTVMLRKAVLEAHSLRYPADYPHAEEYALWLDMAGKCRLANLPDRLLHYRVHAGQVSRTRSEEQRRSMQRLVDRALLGLGIHPSPRDHLVHNLFAGAFSPIPDAGRRMLAWRERLLTANETHGRYSQDELSRQSRQRLEEAVARNRAMISSMSPLRRWRWRLTAARAFWLASPEGKP